MTPRLSIAVPTMNRPELLSELLDSLAAQTAPAHEVVVVDQSADDRSRDVVARHAGHLPVRHLAAEPRGISAAKNIGLAEATGELVAFADDDCRYPPEAVATVTARFAADPDLDVLTGLSVNEEGRPSQGRWATEATRIDRFNVWTTQTSYTTFYRRDRLLAIGGFDENLGVGAGTPWGAGEETEAMLRLLARGARAFYDPALRFTHPEPLAVFDERAMARGRSYNLGFGRVMRNAGYPRWFIAYMVGRPLVGAALSLARLRLDRAAYQFEAGRSRLRGWRAP